MNTVILKLIQYRGEVWGHIFSLTPPLFLRCLFEARKVSDEVHFLIKCSENKVAREQLFLQISQKCKNFTSLSNEQKIFWMLSCEDQSILTSVGKFIYDHMP